MSDLVNASDPGTDVNGEVWGKGAAEKTYEVNGFDPAREDVKLSYTPRRAAKTVFNTYQGGNGLILSGYVAADATYDSRYGQHPGDANVGYQEGGPGADIARIPAGAFDELVVGAVGIVGDEGEKKDVIDRAAADFGIASSQDGLPGQRGKATFTDAWGDVLGYIGFGFNGWFSNDAAPHFTQDKAHGLLGAVAGLKKSNPALKVGLNVGGWEMSQAFHHVAEEPGLRTAFADSLARIFRAFPMFTTLHLDWQFPGAMGASDNVYGPEDPENYARLIREVKQKLDPIVPGGVEIAVAVAGTVEKIKAANVPLLVDAGAGRLNLLAFDFFGSPWSDKLGHHAPLRRDPQAPDAPSVDDAVSYLIQDLKIAPGAIHLAYATSSRNAQRAEIASTSPLKGGYDPYPGATTVGTFKSGESEPADLLRNYLDLENGGARNGFALYTDTVADADFLHNPDSGVFVSLDTPRTVRAKAEYARAHKLGGLYAHRADADTGLLANAAREGLGHTVTGTVVDMKPLYVTGKN
ncbi:glycosyl hydrolase family 18 protein [Streptomyces sp. NPDC017868]|uniref:glycosyl hydrolase family 18 protein n=1 Tax=Streptomyces sp. NPDC017868 TaxID=3365014 RepID=UPI0037A4DFD8